ncbi:hypothetical protein FIV42_10185 [Persicimonas caeni]|uniref:Uncharacterized protein n=1 Tax=Persicimonas caeni TaxID=2292766 RepID=A0A4Y6PSJ7_PERCE|nr:hypothetical protein [Persicimonas caeni]QDG51089.1 hypothetical protein FIV42_10185 [Persicimonas caeni]QED32310.1 hypothetical protein FRD00_10180 [Persicimonas caeni]
MKLSSHNRPLAWARRHAARLILLALYGLVFVPFLHSIDHEDDHVHTPGGGIVYRLSPSDLDDDKLAERIEAGEFAADALLSHHHGPHGHAHDHSHGENHSHDNADSHDELPRSPHAPSPLDHAGDSFAHFAVSITAPQTTLVLPPPVETPAMDARVEPSTQISPRTPRLGTASPRGPPLS